MKVFAYNPTNGTRGDLLDNVQRSTWGDCSVQHAINTGMIKDMGWVSPSNRVDCKHTMHIDGGISDHNGKPVSFQRDDQWVTYCIGECKYGQEKPVWEWVIIPSKKDMELASIK